METTIIYCGYRDNGKVNGNFYSIKGYEGIEPTNILQIVDVGRPRHKAHQNILKW